MAIAHLITSLGDLWMPWPALLVGALLAWSALKTSYPDLVGADDRGRQQIGGDVTFSKDTKFRGRIGSKVVVARGVHLELTGKAGGDLAIERDAIAEVRDKVGGHVRNRGGTLRLSGKLGASCGRRRLHGPILTAIHAGPDRIGRAGPHAP